MQDDVSGDVVTERCGKVEKFLERNFDVGFRIFVLQRAVGIGKDAIAEEKMNGLVDGEFTLFDEMERGDGERELEDRLHGRMSVRFEIAVEGGMGERTGDGNFATRVGGDSVDFLLKVGLRAGRHCTE